MTVSIFFLVGLILSVLGTAITISFWIPRLINKNKLKEILGPKYPLVYVIYIANGPLLLFFGLFLILRFH